MATNSDWLALVTEETLEPDLPICDPHHHLWEFRQERVADRYLMDEIQEDLNAGHNIVSTVFIECGAMYKADGEDAILGCYLGASAQDGADIHEFFVIKPAEQMCRPTDVESRHRRSLTSDATRSEV